MTRHILRKPSILVGCLAVLAVASSLRGEVLIDIDWQSHDAGTLLNTIPGWQPIPGSANNPVIAVDAVEPENKFLTTGTENNQATRDALTFANPGFFSGTTLTFTVDMFDPFINTQSSLSTFPRAYMGIMELGGGASLPSYFGMEHDDASDDVTTAEWVVAGEDFGTPAEAPQKYSSEGSISQDTWYTLRSVWNLGANTKSLEIKLRDSTDAFTPIFTGEAIGFLDPAQPLHELNALAIRMNRGTRIDNILVEYDAVMPPGLAGDYNGDDAVNAADYAIWRDTLNSTTDLTADGDDSGTVDQLDYDFWVARFGNTLGAGGANSVPEPSAFILGLIGAAIAMLYRRPTAR